MGIVERNITWAECIYSKCLDFEGIQNIMNLKKNCKHNKDNLQKHKTLYIA